MAAGGSDGRSASGGYARAGGSPLLEAALGYAARGWPVFPCNPKNKQPLLGADKDAQGKPIRGTGGLKKASTDPEQIAAWWKRWPNALIGLCTGWPTKGTETAEHPAGLPMFVTDFDPRVDADTGEIWTLDRLKSDFEEVILCSLPISMAAMTPSDGVHLYLLAGDGAAVRNSASKFTDHVDVRGVGGYVIAPPSVMGPNAIKGQAGLSYRWHRECEIAHAPPALLDLLRDRGGSNLQKMQISPPPAGLHSGEKINQPERRFGVDGAAPVEESVRKYALAALDGELQAVRSAPSGRRNAQLNESALKLASLVAAGALEARLTRSLLEAAARDNPGRDDDRQLLDTIDSGWGAGMANPRDLSEVAASARSRAERRHPHQPGRSARDAPLPGPQRQASASRPPAPSARTAEQGQPFRDGKGGSNSPQEAGRGAAELSDSDRARLRRIADAWLAKRLESEEVTPDLLKRIAWGCGRRIAAEHLDDGSTREKLWEQADAAGCDFADIERAIDEGLVRGFDPGPSLLDLECGRYPLTDFGLAERFRDRWGEDFRFTTAKGWLGWDGRRWKVLDQDKDTPPAELIAAVFETIRLIQREAKRIRETGVRFVLRKEGKREWVDEDGEPLDAALDYYIPKGKSFIRYSEALAIFGRGSEVAGKPASIASLARRWLTVPIEQFDCEQMAINVMNGTLRFVSHPASPHANPGAGCEVEVRLDPHRREDLMTRLAPVEYDRNAASPLYDAMIAWAQPDPAIRRYVHQVGGYSCSGDTGAHLLWFNYGRGRNGKSVTIDSWCSALGDYSGTIGIESFLDQGIKKRGDAATPDLAKLGGVRMLRASEPERGAKLNSALIKAATGGEPMSVRALHRGFFDLLPRFKLLMSGNSKPGIPDTDEGIWGRMRLVPWKRHIEKPDEDPYRDTFPCPEWPAKDTHLLDKIKAGELAGVFARLVEGLVDYLEHGFVEPEGVTLATADYRQQSDPLGRFLDLCTVRDPASRVKSSEFHELFAAWCKAAGEKEWSPVGFANALIDKGFTKVRSDGMRWEGLRLTKRVGDFVDAEGRPRVLSDDLTKEPPREQSPPATDAGSQVDDDGLPY